MLGRSRSFLANRRFIGRASRGVTAAA